MRSIQNKKGDTPFCNGIFFITNNQMEVQGVLKKRDRLLWHQPLFGLPVHEILRDDDECNFMLTGLVKDIHNQAVKLQDCIG